MLLDTTSTSSSSRCIDNELGRAVCVCVSSSLTNTKGIESHAKISMRGNTDSPMLAKTALVSSASATSSSLSKKTSKHRKSLNLRKKKNSPSRAKCIQDDCMASINRRFKSKGFSENTRKLLSASWRSGAQKDYQCKFRKFSGWCHEREIDSYTASLDHCGNFLIFEKGL